MTDQTDPAALVKPLVWRTSHGVSRAKTAFGDYVVGVRTLTLPLPMQPQQVHEDEEAAKAAAQADYEARILSALTVIDAKALVKATLEQAVKRTAELQLTKTTRAYEDGYSDGVGVCYDAIRALADDPAAVAEIVERAKGESDG